jgi:hypothetical protein
MATPLEEILTEIIAALNEQPPAPFMNDGRPRAPDPHHPEKKPLINLLLVLCMFYQKYGAISVRKEDFVKASPYSPAKTSKLLFSLHKANYIKQNRFLRFTEDGLQSVYNAVLNHLPNDATTTAAFNKQYQIKELDKVQGRNEDAKKAKQQIMRELLKDNGAPRSRASVSGNLPDVKAFAGKVRELKDVGMLSYPERSHLQATEDVWFPFGRP